MSETQNCISKVQISNYKSIVDASIDFRPGLNVIIGKNGSGKTNLLEGIDLALDGYSSDLNSWTAMGARMNLTMPGPPLPQSFDQITISPATLFNNGALGSENADFILLEERRTFQKAKDSGFTEDSNVEFHNPLVRSYLKTSFTRFSIHLDSPFLDDIEFGWHINPGFVQTSINTELSSSSNSLLWLVDDIRTKLHRKILTQIITETKIRNTILEGMISFLERILPDVTNHTPIVGIEVVAGQIDKGNLENSWIAKGFRFRFKIHNHFIPFSQLSDGTKRILKIVIEASQFKFIPSIELESPFRLLMIEEPELGIHPHQLHQLMLFLKEKAKSMQIILTTHSPQVLDILDSEELDRIIISDFDPKNGSQFRHLNQGEIDKAQAYMKDMQLSDYWRFSDLEPR